MLDSFKSAYKNLLNNIPKNFYDLKIYLLCSLLFLVTICFATENYLIRDRDIKLFVPQGEVAEIFRSTFENSESAKENMRDRVLREKSPQKDYMFYALGVLAQKEKNYTQALEYFSQIKLNQIDLLADRVLFHLIQINSELGKEDIVKNLCNKIINYYPNSISAPSAYYELGRSYLRQNKYNQAKDIFNKLIDNYPNSDQRFGAIYYLGQIEKDIEAKNALWEKYMTSKPNGIFSIYIVENWSKDIDNLNDFRQSLIGLHYYYQNKQEEALTWLNKDLNNLTYYPLALILMDKNKKLALGILEQGLKKYPKSKDFENAISFYIRNSAVIDRNNLIEVLISLYNEKADYLLWKKASYSDEKTKLDILNRLVREYPRGIYAEIASSDIFWYLFKNSPNNAEAYAEKHISKYPLSQYTAKVLFWFAKIKEEKGQIDQAKVLYSRLERDFPTVYYAFRAKARLDFLNGTTEDRYANGFFNSNLVNNNKIQDDFEWKLPQKEIESLNLTIQQLFVLNMWEEAFSLLPLDYEKNYPALKIWYIGKVENDISQAIYKANSVLKNKNTKFTDDLDYWYLSYPFLYWKYVKHYSEKYGVDPLLLLSLMRQESRFQKNVISRSEAVGLCQILKPTAKEVCREVGENSNISIEELKDPNLNINLGAKYLSNMLKNFNGNVYLAVGSYNSGPGAMKRWFNTVQGNDHDKLIEKIPYDETKKYIVNVMENYWIYSNIINN